MFSRDDVKGYIICGTLARPFEIFLVCLNAIAYCENAQVSTLHLRRSMNLHQLVASTFLRDDVKGFATFCIQTEYRMRRGTHLESAESLIIWYIDGHQLWLPLRKKERKRQEGCHVDGSSQSCPIFFNPKATRLVLGRRSDVNQQCTPEVN